MHRRGYHLYGSEAGLPLRPDGNESTSDPYAPPAPQRNNARRSRCSSEALCGLSRCAVCIVAFLFIGRGTIFISENTSLQEDILAPKNEPRRNTSVFFESLLPHTKSNTTVDTSFQPQRTRGGPSISSSSGQSTDSHSQQDFRIDASVVAATHASVENDGGEGDSTDIKHNSVGLDDKNTQTIQGFQRTSTVPFFSTESINNETLSPKRMSSRNEETENADNAFENRLNENIGGEKNGVNERTDVSMESIRLNQGYPHLQIVKDSAEFSVDAKEKSLGSNRSTSTFSGNDGDSSNGLNALDQSTPNFEEYRDRLEVDLNATVVVSDNRATTHHSRLKKKATNWTYVEAGLQSTENVDHNAFKFDGQTTNFTTEITFLGSEPPVLKPDDPFQKNGKITTDGTNVLSFNKDANTIDETNDIQILGKTENGITKISEVRLMNIEPESRTVIISKEEYPEDPSRDDDKFCIFFNSPLYRSVYVYPSWQNETDGWKNSIVSPKGGSSNNGTLTKWPWLDVDERTRANAIGHYEAGSDMGQYTLELVVKDIITHPESCLRTRNPDKASLFYVPYLPSMEFHKGRLYVPHHTTLSPYAQAIEDVLQEKYDAWEDWFGLTSKYWKRKKGADHILVFSEPLHGLSHPQNKRGSHHYIHTQRQLTPPIVISVELSTTFVQMYPKCASKNVLVPYPNPDGQWYNGQHEAAALELLMKGGSLNAALKAESNASNGGRPVAQFFNAKPHGSCRNLRLSMMRDFRCTASAEAFSLLGQKMSAYFLGMRISTFCPCPGGDSPSAKRMFDSILAGCIPIILSDDFVWPFSKEFDASIPLDPNEFSLRWKAGDFYDAKYNNRCVLVGKDEETFQFKLEAIGNDEIKRLREGLKIAQNLYSWWRPTMDEGGSVGNLLREGVFPDGGASHALVEALSNRAGGVRWSECEEELKLVHGPDPTKFVC